MLIPAAFCTHLLCAGIWGYRIEENPLSPPTGGVKWLPWKHEGRHSEDGTARLWGETLPHPGGERQRWSAVGAGGGEAVGGWSREG